MDRWRLLGWKHLRIAATPLPFDGSPTLSIGVISGLAGYWFPLINPCRQSSRRRLPPPASPPVVDVCPGAEKRGVALVKCNGARLALGLKILIPLNAFFSMAQKLGFRWTVSLERPSMVV